MILNYTLEGIEFQRVFKVFVKHFETGLAVITVPH